MLDKFTCRAWAHARRVILSGVRARLSLIQQAPRPTTKNNVCFVHDINYRSMVQLHFCSPAVLPSTTNNHSPPPSPSPNPRTHMHTDTKQLSPCSPRHALLHVHACLPSSPRRPCAQTKRRQVNTIVCWQFPGWKSNQPPSGLKEVKPALHPPEPASIHV